MRIYADNAATTKLSPKALEAMLPYFQTEYGNPSSFYREGQQAKSAIEQARIKIARCIGADYKEITFTSGGSEADNQALLTAAAIGKRKGKHLRLNKKVLCKFNCFTRSLTGKAKK